MRASSGQYSAGPEQSAEKPWYSILEGKKLRLWRQFAWNVRWALRKSWAWCEYMSIYNVSMLYGPDDQPRVAALPVVRTDPKRFRKWRRELTGAKNSSSIFPRANDRLNGMNHLRIVGFL